MSENFLLHIDAAKREIDGVRVADQDLVISNLSKCVALLAECNTTDDAMKYIDVGMAASVWARRQKLGLDAQNSAIEFVLRAERRLGEILFDTEKNKGGRPNAKPVESKRQVLTLEEAGISRDLSSRAQKFASVPEDRFEAVIAKAKEEEKEITRRAIEELLSPSKPGRWTVQTGDNQWFTAEIYVESARRVMGGIDLDPACHDEAQKVVRATKYFTEETDGLKQEWRGRVFLNPPYSYPLIADFIKKLCDEFFAGNVQAAILLTNNSTDTKWWHLAARTAAAICFTERRIDYYKADGRASQALQGQCFFYFGVDLPAFATEFSKHGLTIGVYPWLRSGPDDYDGAVLR